jgi:hypothetical protein
VSGLHPILVTCANTGEILAILLRPGNAGSNTSDDHEPPPAKATPTWPPSSEKP